MRFRDELNLSAVNSINWARIAAQIVYYVAAGAGARRARRGRCRSPCRPAISATSCRARSPRAWACRSSELVIGSNRNDILARFLATGDMEMRAVEPTPRPSMDIQVSSNFERLLFEL